MELKVEFDEKSLQSAALRATILKGAVDHLLTVLTPDTLKVFVEKVLAEAFDKISAWDMASAARPYVEKFVKEYMESPEVQERARCAARTAVDTALGKLPGDVANELATMARNEFRKAVEGKLGRY